MSADTRCIHTVPTIARITRCAGATGHDGPCFPESKLVRDRIPELFKANEGRWPKFHYADHDEYLRALRDKLVEEVDEFLSAADVDAELHELVDIIEVVYALVHVRGVSLGVLDVLRQNKEQERGAFDRRIILDETPT